jgi:hypothetical protein
MITAEIFSTLNGLITISREVNLELFHDLFHLLVESLQDMAFVRKRIEAAKCLISLIRTTGFVIYTNYRYPNFTELIYGLFQIEQNKHVAYQLMRLVGCLGALDCFNLFKRKNSCSDEKLVLF